MIDDEAMDRIRADLERFLEEARSGKIVNMQLKCPSCGNTWTTPLNSELRNVEPLWYCGPCWREKGVQIDGEPIDGEEAEL